MSGSEFLAQLAANVAPLAIASTKGDHKGVTVILSDGSSMKFKRADVKAAQAAADVKPIAL